VPSLITALHVTACNGKEKKITAILTYYKICISGGAYAMRDHHTRPAEPQSAYCFRHQLLAADIERRRGLVKQEDGCVTKKRACDDQTLPLPDTQVAECGAHFSFKSIR
jgi:hypothetical protein